MDGGAGTSNRKDTLVTRHNVLGPVSMMDIEIDNGDTLQPVVIQRGMPHRDVVEQAKPSRDGVRHGVRGLTAQNTCRPFPALPDRHPTQPLLPRVVRHRNECRVHRGFAIPIQTIPSAGETAKILSM